MRIFKIFILLSHLSISAQSYSIMLDSLKESGRWGDYYLKENSNGFTLIKQNIEVDSLVFTGDTTLRFLTLNSIFNPIKKSPTSAIAASRFQELQDNHLFIASNSKLSFARYADSNIAAVVDIKTDFKSHIGGIIGSNKDRNGSWKLNGELDLHLENLFRDGSSLSVFWQQPSPVYRFLTFQAEYPVFSKFPFGVSIAYDQEFYEDSYINEAFSSHLISIGRYGRLKIGSKIETINNIGSSHISKTRSASVILQRDRRNARWLPYSGSFLEVESDIGTYNDRAGDALEINSNFHLGVFRPYRSFLINFKLIGSMNHIKDRDGVPAKFIKFGGSSSIRGYQENQFNAEWMTLQSLEFIFGDLPRSQFFTFFDNVFTEDLNINPSSGFGIRVFDGKFFYDVSLGFPLGELRDAKLHIKFNTRL